MRLILLAGIGSFVGGACRYLLSTFIQERHNYLFPLGTFAVNVIGCFVIGCLFGVFEKVDAGSGWRVFLVTGILGGFTTFSAFSVEAFSLFRSGHAGVAILYVLASVTVGVGVTVLGAFVAGRVI